MNYKSIKLSLILPNSHVFLLIISVLVNWEKVERAVVNLYISGKYLKGTLSLFLAGRFSVLLT